MTAPLELSVRCPACAAVFSLDLPQLQRRKGVARCPRCAHVFDAYEAVEPAAPEPPPVATPRDPPRPVSPVMPVMPRAPVPPPSAAVRDEPRIGFSSTPMRGVPSPAAPLPASPASRPVPPPTPAVFRTPEPVAPVRAEPPMAAVRQGDDDDGERLRVVHEPDEDLPEGYDEPIYLEPRDRDDDALPEAETVEPYGYDDEPQTGRRTGLWLLAAVVAVLLALQSAYAWRVQLADRLPALRPLLASACTALGCDLPYARHIDRIAIMRSALNSLPADGAEAGQAMRLSLTLRNQYAQPQEWPTLVLDLTDAAGTRVVSMQLPPARYLSADVLAQPFPAVSDVEASVDLRVGDVRVNGFQLDKFFP